MNNNQIPNNPSKIGFTAILPEQSKKKSWIHSKVEIITVISAFAIDRLTKVYLPVHRYCNDGAAFGLLKGQNTLLAIFGALVVLTLIVILIRKQKKLNILQKIGLSLVIGGTAGNLLDRVLYGYVIDFINLKFINFPVFNMADVFINAGAAILLITLLARR